MSDDSLAPLTLQTAPRNAQVLMEQTSHTLRTLAYDLGRLTSGEQMMAWHPLTHQQRAELVLVGLQEWDKQNPGAYAGPVITPGPQPQQSMQPQETAAPMNQPPPYPPQGFPQQPPQQPQFQPQQPGFGQQQPPQGYGAPQPGFQPPQAPQQAFQPQPQYAPPQAPQGGPPPPPAFTPQAQPYPQQQPAPQHAPQYPQQGFPQQPPPMQPQAPQMQPQQPPMQPQMQPQAPQGMQPPPFQPNGAPRPGGFQPPAIVPPPQPVPPPQAPPMTQQPMFPAPSGVDPAAQGFAGAATAAEAPGKTRGKREPKPAAAAGVSGDAIQLLTNLTSMVQQLNDEVAVLKRLTGISAANAVTTFGSTYNRDPATSLQHLMNEASVITQQLTPGKG